MNSRLQRSFKAGLTRIGAHVSARTVHRFNAALNYIAVGRWMAVNNFDIGWRFRLVAADQILAGRPSSDGLSQVP